MTDLIRPLAEVDPDIHQLIGAEVTRQEDGLELIASENFVSTAVLEAMGSALTNKYAEGYPRRRYYGGCEVVDQVEQLAIDRAKTLFDADHANVQAHSGAQANMAAFMSVLEPGDTLMGLALPHGGHLTHGAKVNFSGQLYHAVAYHVREDTGLIDYDEVADLAREHRPKLIIGGGSAYPRVVDFSAMRAIADEVGAILLVDMAHFAGLVAAEVYPSPVPHAQIVTTTTHKTLRGPRGGLILARTDYGKGIDKKVFPGMQGGPLEHVIAAKAVALYEASQPAFRTYAAQVIENAKILGDALAQFGFVLVSGGTDSHLLLVDLRPKGLTGKEAEEALDEAGITVNKNTIPGDPQSPFVTSGIRIGTSAVTTRGMDGAAMQAIAELIDRVLTDREPAKLMQIREEVRDLTQQFPLYRQASVSAV